MKEILRRILHLLTHFNVGAIICTMGKQLTTSRLFLVLFLLFSIISVLAVVFWVSAKWEAFIPVLLTWAVAFLKMLYDSSSKVYFAVNRLLAYALNKTSRWEFAIRYVFAEAEQDTLDKVCNAAIEAFPGSKLWQNTAKQKIVNTDRFTIRMQLIEKSREEDIDSTNEQNLYVDLTDLTVPYRYTVRILYRETLPLFEKIGKELKAQWIKYTLRIKYEDTNPFFGLYIRKMPIEQVSNFHCELFEMTAGETDNIQIGKRETIINASSLSGFMRLSRKYLLLSTSTNG